MQRVLIVAKRQECLLSPAEIGRCIVRIAFKSIVPRAGAVAVVWGADSESCMTLPALIAAQVRKCRLSQLAIGQCIVGIATKSTVSNVSANTKAGFYQPGFFVEIKK